MRLKYSWPPTGTSAAVFQTPVFCLISTKGEGLVPFERLFQTDLVQWVIRPHVCGLCARACVFAHMGANTQEAEKKRGLEGKGIQSTSCLLIKDIPETVCNPR